MANVPAGAGDGARERGDGTLAVGVGEAAVAAGLQMVKLLRDQPGVYQHLEVVTATLEQGLVSLCREAGVAAQVNRVGSMITLFFTGEPVTDFASAKRSDTARFKRFFHGMLQRGVYLPPSQFEAAFLCSEHSHDLIDQTLSAARATLAELG